MAMLPGMAMPHVVAFCRSTSIVCPKCGRVFLRVSVPADGGVMLFCDRKRSSVRGKRVCGGRAYATAVNEEQSVVISITEEQWDRLKKKRGHEIIADLGLVVEAITDLNKLTGGQG